MKRGYALKEKSKGKKNELVRKNNKNEPQTKRPGKWPVKNSTAILFANSQCADIVLTTLDGWPNS